MKVGLCKELESNIFDYGISNAADLMRTMQEKIGEYVGIKYGEDIANELTNKTTVIIPPPVYIIAIHLLPKEIGGGIYSGGINKDVRSQGGACW